MNSPAPRPPARRAPLVLAALAVLAILGFAGVSRLVTRLKANEKQIAWHAYQAGLAEVQAGHAESALDDFRAALVYDRDNPSYQLSLARALRDSGRLDESEGYLLHLWGAAPQDSTINLALARLAARRQSIDNALRYYHNAIYGVWASDPDRNRRQARLELIEFLLKENARSEARAELVALGQILPPDPAQRLAAAALFVRVQDYQNALAQYQAVLKLDRKNDAALAGAGEAAFQLGHYKTAQKLLRNAIEQNPRDDAVRERLQTATLVLESDPFLPRISDVERNRRIAVAFTQAGDRLKTCARSKNIELRSAFNSGNAPSTLNTGGNDLQSLWGRWGAVRPELHRLNSASNTDLPDIVMDLILEIERQTAQQCGDPSGVDLALLLASRDREMVDQ